MTEIFLSTICFISAIGWVFLFRRIFIEQLQQGEDIQAINRFLHKLPSKDDLECRFRISHECIDGCKRSVLNELKKTTDELRVNIITQMGDLATKSDLVKLRENEAKLKEDRYKNMRLAFGGKEEI